MLSISIQEFVERYPGPPPIGRGERRHTLSIAVSEHEYDAITRLAHHPEARSMYDGSISTLVRHAICNYLWPMSELMDVGFKSIGDRLHDEIDTANLIESEKEILELLDIKARRLNLLLNHDQFYGALEEYDKLLDYIEKLGSTWAPVVHKYMQSHQEMQLFRDRVRRMGDSEANSLKSVEEKPR